jgi:thiol-disulfide isomerase/thioredoxin
LSRWASFSFKGEAGCGMRVERTSFNVSHMKSRYIAVIATTLFTLGTSLSAQDLGIDIGAKAPVVSVQALDGKQVSLGNYIGRTPMLIEFWATWCPNCKELMPTLLNAEKKFGKQVKFVAIAVAINQSPEKVRRWLAAHPLPHDTFYDVEGKAAGAFDAPATSYVVVLDKTGKVVYTGLGGKQDLESAIRKAL